VPRKSAPYTEELESIYRAMQEEASDVTPVEGGGKSASIAEPEPGEGASPSEESESPPIDFADILAAAQNEFGVTPLVESTEPLLESLSQQVKDDIPSLIYSEHNYDPSGRLFRDPKRKITQRASTRGCVYGNRYPARQCGAEMA
jgi:hypothetical protein